MLRRLSLVLLLALGTACRGERAAPEQLRVFAAASLASAFNELTDSLKLTHPQLAVEFHFAGSQALVFQLLQGARADVFASADQRWMDVARDSGLVNSTPSIFAHNHLVVVIPAANPGRIARLQDLARKGTRLILAGDAVPAGRYARESLAKLGAGPGFAPGYAETTLANVVSNEESVRGVMTKVELGEADAGIVYVTDARSEKVRTIAIPEEANVTAVYPVAPLARAGNVTLARAFVDLLLSGTGQRVLNRHGFIAPPV